MVAFFPWHSPDKIFALLNEFYPLPKPGIPGKLLRDTPYLPYLTFAPSAFVFPLKFTGGGVSGGGKLMIDSEGNAWVADNFYGRGAKSGCLVDRRSQQVRSQR